MASTGQLMCQVELHCVLTVVRESTALPEDKVRQVDLAPQGSSARVDQDSKNLSKRWLLLFHLPKAEWVTTVRLAPTAQQVQ